VAPKRIVLTYKRLDAMVWACEAALAGADHEGDWPAAVSRADLQAASDWAKAQLGKRKKPAGYDEDAP
jgi:hypothetical protein